MLSSGAHSRPSVPFSGSWWSCRWKAAVAVKRSERGGDMAMILREFLMESDRFWAAGNIAAAFLWVKALKLAVQIFRSHSPWQMRPIGHPCFEEDFFGKLV